MVYPRGAAEWAAGAPSKSFLTCPVPTVFVVHKDEPTRNSLESLIGRQKWGARTYPDARTFLSSERAAAPSCLVVGLYGDDKSGLDLQQCLLDRPELPIVFVSDSRDIGTAVKAIRAGALEFLLKPVSERAFLCAIEHAIERSNAVLCYEAEVRALLDRHRALTDRERDVMELLISGRLNKEVAGELGIAEITVKVHRAKLMRKMNAGSFAELVKMGMELQSETARVAVGDA